MARWMCSWRASVRRHHHRVSCYIKKTKGKAIVSVAVEPSESPVISQKLAGEEIKPGPHKIQGIGAGFIPGNLDLSLLDRVEQVSSDEAIEMARRLMEEEGILAVSVLRAAVVAANRLAEQPEFEGKTIVVILPSAAERYLSSALRRCVQRAGIAAVVDQPTFKTTALLGAPFSLCAKLSSHQCHSALIFGVK